jgi:signal transduction histidine kinase
MAHDLRRPLASLRAHGEWADARLISAVSDLAADAAPPATEALRELAVELARMGTIIDARMRRLCATLTPDALSQEIAYTNLEGLPSRTALGEILLPLLMHGHDHRGTANVAR